MFLLSSFNNLGVYKRSSILGGRFGSNFNTVVEVENQKTAQQTAAPWGAWQVDDVFEYGTPVPKQSFVGVNPLKTDDMYYAEAVQEVIAGNREAGLTHFQSELESDLKAQKGHPETQFQTLLHAAQELQALGENQTAHQCFERAKRLAQEAGLSLDTQKGLALQSARNAKDAGSWAQAEGFYKGLLTHSTPGTVNGIEHAQILGELGEVVWHLSKPLEAEQHFKGAISILSKLPDNDWSTKEAVGEAVSRLYTLYLNTRRDSEAEALKAQYAHCSVPIIPAGF